MALNSGTKPAKTKHITGTNFSRVTPVEVDRVRRNAYDIVRRTLPDVRRVLRSEIPWTNQQVRLFGMLLNKVLPDLHHSYTEHHHEHRQIHEMSVQELESIVANAKVIEGTLALEEQKDETIIEAPQPSPPSSEAPVAYSSEDDDPELSAVIDLDPVDPSDAQELYESDLRKRRLRLTRRIDKMREKIKLQNRSFTPEEQKALDLLLQERSRIPTLTSVRARRKKVSL